MPQKQTQHPLENPSNSSRRSFIKSGGMILAGGAIVGSNAKIAKSAHVYGSDTIKLGLVGCGRRGIKAAIDALNTNRDSNVRSAGAVASMAGSSGQVELVAIADVFKSNLHTAYRTINGQHAANVKCDLSRFDGTQGYQGVMASDADVVILATPPVFRPLHFEAAITARKHVFMEKPVAADVDGVRRILNTGAIAQENGLAVQVGFQRRHELRYQQTIDQLRSGLIGDVVMARTYCNVNEVPLRRRRNNESELAYQIRNWQAFDWLGGGLMVEQHVQNLDVINWLIDACPVAAESLGTSEIGTAKTSASLAADCPMVQADDGPRSSLVQQAVEFTYPSGEKLISQCRYGTGCWNKVGEHVHGTQGSADISAAKIFDSAGKLAWQSTAAGTKGNGWQVQLDHFFDALRRGERPNETEFASRSTMTAILGRMAAESRRVVRWDTAINQQNRFLDVSALEV